MGEIRFGPHFIPARESPEEAVAELERRGYDACEVDFEGGFWMDKEFAAALGERARDAGIVLSVHAPLFAFVGRPDPGDKKLRTAVGMLDHTAGLTVALGAELMVVHPGFLFGRDREQAIDSVVDQLAAVRERLEGKDRGVTFGIEVMGRVAELGSLDDVMAIASRLDWVRPVLDFAHMHATSDGAFLEADRFAHALAAADSVIEPGAPFHIHFSDIAYANRNEKSHLPYGEGTLRAEPLAEALAGFDRPATVIGESPDEESNQAIARVLAGAVA